VPSRTSAVCLILPFVLEFLLNCSSRSWELEEEELELWATLLARAVDSSSENTVIEAIVNGLPELASQSSMYCFAC
jgi:hypothetical protein